MTNTNDTNPMITLLERMLDTTPSREDRYHSSNQWGR